MIKFDDYFKGGRVSKKNNSRRRRGRRRDDKFGMPNYKPPVDPIKQEVAG